MISRCLLLFLLAAATLPLLAQTSAPSRNKNDLSQRFAKLSDQFMKESLVLSPVNASQAGYHLHRDPRTEKTIALDAELDDLCPQAFVRQVAFNRAWRDRFHKETPLTSLGAQDAADWQLMDDQIALVLLELQRIQSYRHNPTGYVELIGNALFVPLTESYAAKEVRLGHILSRIGAIPRALTQARQNLADSDPIFSKVAIEENAGNVDLIESTIAAEIPAGSPLRGQYDKVAPGAIAALKEFSGWLAQGLGKAPAGSWRLGKPLYAEKFRYVMQTPVTPEQVLADAERDMKRVRAEMLEMALPMHQQWFAEHGGHSDLQGRDRENRIISEVLERISLDHPRRDQLVDAVKNTLEEIKQFIREKKIVALSSRDNLKVIPTPKFMRGIYSVAGFHSAPPLEPQAEAQYWVTPIDPKMPADKAESKLREYNNWALKWLTIHEALPGHYIQFEHANNVQPETRRLLRNLFSNGCYVEGWAEYIAEVMTDAGFANRDPRYRIMRRKLSLRVISNAILDVRMQTMGMTDGQAMELMTGEAFQTQAEAEGKLQRAKLSSAQLPTYYVGLRDWMALRKKYEDAVGPNFNLMQFHNLVLGQGALPIMLLEKIVMPAGSR